MGAPCIGRGKVMTSVHAERRATTPVMRDAVTRMTAKKSAQAAKSTNVRRGRKAVLGKQDG